ncbi:hypothetical protein MMC31_003127 [Peltigera leucophlebia]|nr:hypothetical protein [Peltigera leucophlebia]
MPVVKWTRAMELVLLDSMVDSVRNGLRAESGFKKAAWTEALRMIWYKTKWKEWLIIDDLSGWGWDHVKELPTADNATWDAHIIGHPDARSLRYSTLHHRIQLEELFYGILAIGNKSQTVQQRITASDNPPNPDPDEGNDRDTPDNTPDNIPDNTPDNIPDNTPEDVPVEQGDSNSNQGSSRNTPGTQATSKRTRSARGDDPPPKRAKVTGGHVLADSIVAVVEEMRTSRKDRATTALELTKTQAEVARELYESQVKLARTTT